MLVDQFIAGVHSKHVVNKLLSEKDGLNLTFAKAMQIAEEEEVNQKNAVMYVSRNFRDLSTGSNENNGMNAVRYSGSKPMHRNFSGYKPNASKHNFSYKANDSNPTARPRPPPSDTGRPNMNQKSATFGTGRKCFRCNDTRHLANKCKFKNTQCRKCQRWGHISAACQDGNVLNFRNHNIVLN